VPTQSRWRSHQHRVGCATPSRARGERANTFLRLGAPSRFSASRARLSKQPVAICLLPSLMIQMARATTRPGLRRAGRSHNLALLLGRGIGLMRSIYARVVYSLPAMHSTIKWPRARSRRSPETVIGRSGKASAAATLSRSGVRRNLAERREAQWPVSP
jgi:hypothetical protein